MEATMNSGLNPPTHVPSVAPPVATMQAMVQDQYGKAEDVLRLVTVDRPEIGDGDVLVRVYAAGVDRGVWHVTTGLPYPVRLVSGIRSPKARVPGTDVAGRVEAVGKDVTTLRVGYDVFGIADGSFAEYTRARQDKLMPKPKNLTYEADGLELFNIASVPVDAGLSDARDTRECVFLRIGPGSAPICRIVTGRLLARIDPTDPERWRAE
jgi:threonine dehydrogenase-like Zn-dependent dehydrogenase